jgi:hypothetical protein
MSEMMVNTQNLEYQLKMAKDRSQIMTPGKSRPTSANVSNNLLFEKSTAIDSNRELDFN